VKGLEWETASPPPTATFDETPIVTVPAYAYTSEDAHV
jgi:heme/copper-type cytochrome/quinol oxidase subunit 1